MVQEMNKFVSIFLKPHKIIFLLCFTSPQPLIFPNTDELFFLQNNHKWILSLKAQEIPIIPREKFPA